jgi:hypothetical protein
MHLTLMQPSKTYSGVKQNEISHIWCKELYRVRRPADLYGEAAGANLIIRWVFVQKTNCVYEISTYKGVSTS